jgi:hypothetical protein
MAKHAKQTVDTINVVEYCDNNVIAVYSFKNTPQGQEEAKQMFREVAKDNAFKKDEIEEGLSEGSLSHSDSDYQVFLISSQS